MRRPRGGARAGRALEDVDGSSSNGSMSTIDALWLDTLQRICSRASHELKGALNGVSVNLEVVRSRAEKPDSPASTLRPFAENAAAQLGHVIAMTESLLALSRPAREPVELAALVRRFEAVVAPAARAEGRSLTIEEPIDAIGTTATAPNAVRLALGASLLRAMEEANRVTCRAEDGDERRLRLDADDGEQLTLDPTVVLALRDAGIHIVAEGKAITIAFPSGDDERRSGRS
jgi:signal transduction histidine kinase